MCKKPISSPITNSYSIDKICSRIQLSVPFPQSILSIPATKNVLMSFYFFKEITELSNKYSRAPCLPFRMVHEKLVYIVWIRFRDEEL